MSRNNDSSNSVKTQLDNTREIPRASVFSSLVGTNHLPEQRRSTENEASSRSNFKIPTPEKYDGRADFDFLEQCFFDINNFFEFYMTHVAPDINSWDSS